MALFAVLAALALPTAALAAADGPTAIGQDSQGVSYVGYAAGGQIARFDGNGNPLSSWGTAGSGVGQIGGVVGISVDPSGNVWVLDTNLRVQEFTASGTYITGFTLPACASGVTPDPIHYGGIAVVSGSVYVAHPCASTILRYGTGGNQIASRTLSGRPRGIAVGAAGGTGNQVFVALPDQKEVDTFRRAYFGQNGNEPPLQINGTPAAVTAKTTGDELIVADVANNYIYVYNPGQLSSGQYQQYRVLGHGTGNALGSVNGAVAIAQHANDGSGYDSNIFIADYGNNRIQRWNDSGYTFWAANAESSTTGGGGTSAPTNTGAPAITGSATVGSQVTCGNGSWNGSPTSYSYTWSRNGGQIATGQTYTLVGADAGQQITCAVVASNAGGASSPATSAPIVPAATGSAPASTSPPAITGAAAQGGTLTCNTGTWTGSTPISYSYSWSRNGAQIATGQTYVLTAADVNQAITCTQTATNSAGTNAATSLPVVPTTTVAGGKVGVTIDNGAIYTNSPAATLTIVPPSGTTQVIVSNDGSFAQSSTFAVAGNQHYSWTLATSGADRLPKTVYVRFVASGVPAYQTLTDDIVLDQTAPTIQQAALAPAGTSAISDIATRSGRAHASAAILRVKAHDTVSGVAKLQYGKTRSAAKSVTVRYAKSIRIAHAAKVKWVRAIDKAGNYGRWHRVRGI